MHDLYWGVFEPFAENKPDAIHGSISDELADIWRDVKKGLSTFDRGKPNCIKDAVWHWRFSFGTHWGYHVAGAIRALTALHAARVLLTNEGFEAPSLVNGIFVELDFGATVSRWHVSCGGINWRAILWLVFT